VRYARSLANLLPHTASCLLTALPYALCISRVLRKHAVTVCAAHIFGTPHALYLAAVVTTAAGTFVVERVGRRTLLAVGGSVIAATMALLAVLLAAVPIGPALLPVALVLLCVNRVALTCTLQPLAATGRCTVRVQHVFMKVSYAARFNVKCMPRTCARCMPIFQQHVALQSSASLNTILATICCNACSSSAHGGAAAAVLLPAQCACWLDHCLLPHS
jgi:hypothetical protein